MQIVNIVSGDAFRVGDAYDWICEYTGKTIPLRMTPEAANVANRTLTNGLALELGWKPDMSFSEGLEKTINWYLKNEDWMNNIVSGDYEKYYEKQYKNR